MIKLTHFQSSFKIWKTKVQGTISSWIALLGELIINTSEVVQWKKFYVYLHLSGVLCAKEQLKVHFFHFSSLFSGIDIVVETQVANLDATILL